jgi:hypothetical protein
MEKLEKFGSFTPLGRPGQPAELGSIYVPPKRVTQQAKSTGRPADRDSHSSLARLYGERRADGYPFSFGDFILCGWVPPFAAEASSA